MALPRFAAFQSKNSAKYLNYVTSDDAVIPNFLQYASDEVVTIYTKFELELASTGEDLVNIRCCYNNKYWRVESSSENWVVAIAEEPNEDQSDWACTLFQPIYDSTNEAYRFVHVQRGEHVVLWDNVENHPNCLYISSISQSLLEYHIIIDWESLLVLPKYIVFKGDNDKYLAAHSQDDHQYLKFSSEDNGASTVGNEVFTTADGSVRIKSNYWGKFWRRSPNWIWADSTDTGTSNKDTLFWPVKVNANTVALRNLGNDAYCKRLTLDFKEDCLNAGDGSISKYSELVIEEYVLSRTIYNVQYRLSDSRIYGQSIIGVDFQEAMNATSEPNTMGLNFSYTDEKSSTWDSMLEMKIGLSISMDVGIPLITSGQIEISSEFTGSYSWGETHTTSVTKESTYEVTVPPMTKVKVSLVTTKGYCDVPFSYTQRDVLADGTTQITEHDDGVYSGINCYNYNYEVVEEAI